MNKVRIVSVASLAQAFGRFSIRLKSSDGRPSSPLGSRFLTDPDDIFKHNMWDHVQWTEEEKENARQKARENSRVKIPLNEQGKFDTDAHSYWDKFYETHRDQFFKDRNWLFLEFPELDPSGTRQRHASVPQTEILLPTSGAAVELESSLLQEGVSARYRGPISDSPDGCDGASVGADGDVPQTPAFPGQHASFRILEVGCGVGNSVFPIVKTIKEKDAFLYCCDFSPRAVDMVKNHKDYDETTCHAFVHDVCDEEAEFPFPPRSLDVILTVFVLSSIHPERIKGVVKRLSSYLKYGGIFLFRDHGRHDLKQLRFKKGQCLSDNFYTRGNGTTVYFFTKEEVHHLFSSAGLQEVQNLEDRRLQVNRGLRTKMLRVWMQSKYRRPHHHSPPSELTS